MNRGLELIQAYRQAPWRRQLQVIGLFSASVVFVALVGGVYLNVSARAATIGREIQDMQADIQEMQQTNEDLVTQLALLSSARVMEARAREMGFEPVDSEDITYLVVSGYGGRQTATLAPPPGARFQFGPQLPREFTISLLEWMQEFVYQIGLQTGAYVGGGTP